MMENMTHAAKQTVKARVLALSTEICFQRSLFINASSAEPTPDQRRAMPLRTYITASGSALIDAHQEKILLHSTGCCRHLPDLLTYIKACRQHLG